MAELNGRKYETWEGYINDKFPAEQFSILENKETSSVNIITVTSKDSAIKTKIVFDFPTSGLCRVCFYNEDSPLLNANNDKERLRALMYSDYELTDENLLNTNEYLHIPLYYGWTEQVTFYKNRLIKSELLYFDGTVWQSMLLEQNISWFDKSGCLLSLLAWPVLYIQHKIAKRKFSTGNKNLKITTSHILPMVPPRSTSR